MKEMCLYMYSFTKKLHFFIMLVAQAHTEHPLVDCSVHILVLTYSTARKSLKYSACKKPDFLVFFKLVWTSSLKGIQKASMLFFKH